MSLTDFMTKLCDDCGIIDVGALCILPGKLAWVLYADVVVLNANGGVTDACVLALLGALMNVKLPRLSEPSLGMILALWNICNCVSALVVEPQC